MGDLTIRYVSIGHWAVKLISFTFSTVWWIVHHTTKACILLFSHSKQRKRLKKRPQLVLCPKRTETETSVTPLLSSHHLSLPRIIVPCLWALLLLLLWAKADLCSELRVHRTSLFSWFFLDIYMYICEK